MNRELLTPFLKNLYRPPSTSHKGQNGKVLIIGGSQLFHAASLWAAQIASHFVDMVHYASTPENNEILLSMKKKFTNGIVVHQKDILSYVQEDDAVLIGPGMVRDDMRHDIGAHSFNGVLHTRDEALFARELTHYLLHNFPHKKYVIDAGALQMMDPNWLKNCSQKAIITPHQIEFERVFKISLANKSLEEKKQLVKQTAHTYNTVIILKVVVDIISDGQEVWVVEGGNAGLTKGGTGDVLAGLIVALYAKNEAVASCILASYVLKQAAQQLEKSMHTWYNTDNLIQQIPATFKKLLE